MCCSIDFQQLAAPNLAKSAVLRMLEEEENAGSRGELTVKRPPGRLPQGAMVWPPPSPPGSPPTRRARTAVGQDVLDKRTHGVAWPPTSRIDTARCVTPNLEQTNEQTNSSWRQRCSNQQGNTARTVKIIATSHVCFSDSREYVPNIFKIIVISKS